MDHFFEQRWNFYTYYERANIHKPLNVFIMRKPRIELFFSKLIYFILIKHLYILKSDIFIYYLKSHNRVFIQYRISSLRNILHYGQQI